VSELLKIALYLVLANVVLISITCVLVYWRRE